MEFVGKATFNVGSKRGARSMRNTYGKNNRRGGMRGIGLIELCLFVVASGLILAGATPVYSVYLDNKHLDTTNTSIAQVQSALDTFYLKNGRYPCPAPRNAKIDGANSLGNKFGVEQTNCSIAGGTVAGDGTVSTTGRTIAGTPWKIRIGTVPVRTLGLPDSADIDGWGHLLTYAVTAPYAVAALAPKDMLHGAISVVDSKGNPVTAVPGTAVYVVSGANPDGSGAYNMNGVAPLACSSGSSPLEVNRCNAQGTSALPFISTMLQPGQGTRLVTNVIAFASACSESNAICSSAPTCSGTHKVIITTSGTWTNPGCTNVGLIVAGGGGGGGGGNSPGESFGGGGGGGGISVANVTITTADLTITIGAGGAGGKGGNNPGGAGAASSVTQGATILSANGGSGGDGAKASGGGGVDCPHGGCANGIGGGGGAGGSSNGGAGGAGGIGTNLTGTHGGDGIVGAVGITYGGKTYYPSGGGGGGGSGGGSCTCTSAGRGGSSSFIANKKPLNQGGESYGKGGGVGSGKGTKGVYGGGGGGGYADPSSFGGGAGGSGIVVIFY